MEHIQDIIRLHVALMYRQLLKPYLGRPVDLTTGAEIIQLGHDIQRELLAFAQNLGEPEAPNAELDDSVRLTRRWSHAELDIAEQVAESDAERSDPHETLMNIMRNLS